MIFRKLYRKLDTIINSLQTTKQQPFFVYLRDSRGDANATGNYKQPTEYFYQAVKDCTVARLIFSIKDEAPMHATEYGHLTKALPNGWSLYLNDIDLTDGEPVRTNADIAKFCYDVDVKSWGAGPELLVARWSFNRTGEPLYLKTGDVLKVVLNDDFTRLQGHYFNVQGTC